MPLDRVKCDHHDCAHHYHVVCHPSRVLQMCLHTFKDNTKLEDGCDNCTLFVFFCSPRVRRFPFTVSNRHFVEQIIQHKHKFPGFLFYLLEKIFLDGLQRPQVVVDFLKYRHHLVCVDCNISCFPQSLVIFFFLVILPSFLHCVQSCATSHTHIPKLVELKSTKHHGD